MQYSFDQSFQEKIAAFLVRDGEFVATAAHLVEPDFFSDPTLATLVAVQKNYITKYGEPCDATDFITFFRGQIKSRAVKKPDMAEAKKLIASIFRKKLTGGAYITDEVKAFARFTRMTVAAERFMDAVDNEDLDEAMQAVSDLEEARDSVDTAEDEPIIIGENTHDRAKDRKDRSGAKGGGVTTGCYELDKALGNWEGWGKKELSILMGPPKSGKTAALITFAVNAARAGNMVYYASCEVSKEILSDRADSNISGVAFGQLNNKPKEVADAVEAAFNQSGGELIVDDFPAGTLTVSQLRRVLEGYRRKGIVFDLVVVDYIDEMAAERRDEKRHELASITRGLRALAYHFDNAFLTATQTNKEGTKKANRAVTTGEDVAEDYNKVRIADVLITINASDQDRDNGQVVLYFAEMRNVRSGRRFRFTQQMECFRFIEKFDKEDT